MNQNTTKRKNILKDFLLGDKAQKVNKTSVAAIFRALIEPMIECRENSVILVKVEEKKSFENVLKRINFINPNIYSFSSGMDFLKNVQVNPILEKSEFLIILSPRYSAAMIWDYTLGQDLAYEKDTTPFFILLNSREVNEIAENLLESVNLDLKDVVRQYTPERRENSVMNKAIGNIIKSFDDFSVESNFAQLQTELPLINENKTNDYSEEKMRHISHEIKNHLSIIDLYSKIIEKKLAIVSEKLSIPDIQNSCNTAINSIRKSIFSVSFLINSFREKEIRLEKICLKSLLDNVYQMVHPRLENQNVKLNFDISEKIMILADEIMFQNVILNLLYNSIDAISDGGKIDFSVEEQERYIKLFISDTGKGISPEVKENLFKEGFTTKTTGQGLGLNICKDAMLKMGGDIRLKESKPGCTIFEILVQIA